MKSIDNFQNGSIFVVQYRDKTTDRPGGDLKMTKLIAVTSIFIGICAAGSLPLFFLEEKLQEKDIKIATTLLRSIDQDLERLSDSTTIHCGGGVKVTVYNIGVRRDTFVSQGNFFCKIPDNRFKK